MAGEQFEPKLVIEKLAQSHGLDGFECSSAILDAWLKRFAWTNQRAETAKTYVAQGASPNHPVGVILMARLAVDKSEHGKGLGKALLRDALARISQAADLVGVRAALVHAIDDAARSFYLHHGFQPSQQRQARRPIAR